MRDVLAALDAQGLAAMQTEGVARDRISTRYAADMRYVGQSYELEVDVPDTTDRSTPDELARRFHEAHERIYAQCAAPQRGGDGQSSGRSQLSPRRRRALPPTERAEPTETNLGPPRRAVFAEYPEGVDAAVFDRVGLPSDSVIDGPAIVEQPDTTTVVYPGHRCTVGDDGLLFVTFAVRRPGRRGHEERVQ